MGRDVIFTEKTPEAIGPYSQGIAMGNLVFTAGQVPLDPETGWLVEGDIVAQAERALKNIEAVLEAAGSGLDRILRLDVYLTDLGQFQAVNGYMSGVFKDEPPARVTVEVAGLPMGAEIEIAAIAAR